MEKNYDVKISEGTSRSGLHVLRRLGVLPFFVFVALIAILVRMDLRAVFEPPLLLPLLNTVFLSAIPFAVAYYLARGYVRSGSFNLLLLGCGMMILGTGAFLAGWLPASDGPNVNVTLYNVAALLGAVFHVTSAIITSAGGISGEEPRGSNVKAILAYLGVLVFAALLTIASLQGALPPFFIQGVGSTVVRQAVLGIATALFAYSSLLFMVRYARTKSDFLYWYSLALALLAVGLFAVLFQKTVGSPIGWAGRSAQYLGGIYFLIAALTAARSARVRGMPLDKALAEFFRTAEAQYEALVETSSDAIISVHQKGRILLWNAAAVKIFGYTRDEALDSSLIDLIIPEKYADRMREELEKLATTGKSSLIGRATELEAKRRDGELFPAELSVSARKTVDGWVGTIIIRDITERKRAEEALRESEKKLRLVTDQVTDVIWSMDLQGNFTFVTPSVERITGYTVDEVLSLNFSQLITPESFKTTMALINQRMKAETREPVTVEIEQIRKDGSRAWCEVRAILVVDQNNRPTGIVGVTRDITERKQAEDALRTSEAQLSNAMKIAQLGYWEYDVANDLFTFNDHFYAIFRTSVEQVGGYTMSSARYAQLFVHPDDVAVVGIEIRKAIETTDPLYSRQLEHRIIYADGEIGYIAVRFFIVKDNQGRTVKTYGANQDITDRKRLADERERYLKELEQRNAEMERFVYTISHELRTPLVTLQGYSDLVQRDLERNDKTRVTTDLTFIQNAVTSMGQLLEDTLELSRTGRVMNPPVDVPFGALIRDALAQLAELIKWSGAKVLMAEDFPTVHVDRTRLVEVLVNLIENSIKFMGDQPKPKIEIGCRTADNETVFFVKDNGIGLEKSQHEKIFQLFYKVDKKSKGSGAGLAIVKRIIEVHNGRIWVESEAGKGCTVWFTLPVLGRGTSEPAQEAVRGAP
jgi:PAS domain S-box-containing protein